MSRHTSHHRQKWPEVAQNQPKMSNSGQKLAKKGPKAAINWQKLPKMFGPSPHVPPCLVWATPPPSSPYYMTRRYGVSDPTTLAHINHPLKTCQSPMSISLVNHHGHGHGHQAAPTLGSVPVGRGLPAHQHSAVLRQRHAKPPAHHHRHQLLQALVWHDRARGS
jgi:hypothetical protein